LLLRGTATGLGSQLDRFVSHYTNRFDAKGRISIPASFRAVLAKDGFEGLYVHPSLDAPALDCGGNALLREIDALLETMPAYSEPRDVFATALLGTSEILRPDSEGRVILSEASRASIGLTGEAVFVGHGHKFQIWEPGRFASHLEEAKSRARQLRAELGARARAAPQGARE
jgi:MraZ protein